MFLWSVAMPSLLAICRQQIPSSAKCLIFDAIPAVTLIVYRRNGKRFKFTKGPFEKIISNILQISLTYLVYEFSAACFVQATCHTEGSNWELFIMGRLIWIYSVCKPSCLFFIITFGAFWSCHSLQISTASLNQCLISICCQSLSGYFHKTSKMVISSLKDKSKNKKKFFRVTCTCVNNNDRMIMSHWNGFMKLHNTLSVFSTRRIKRI